MSAVPKLRFSEFSETWQIARLDEVSKIQRGRFSPRPRNDPRYYGGKIPFVQTNEVTNSNGYVTAHSQTLNEEGLKVSKLFQAGTILITIAANIGYTAILSYDMACPDSLVGIVCNQETSAEFLNFYLSTQQERMSYLAPEAAQKNINIEFLSPYKVVKTTLPEQKKIADFLGAVDDKIAGLRERESLLTQYKKGVMQKIFTQALRFKADDGSDFPDWEAIKLGNYATFKKGKGISKADIVDDGTSKCIRYGELYTEYDEVIEKVVSRTNQPVSSSVISQPNDLLMPTSDVTPNGLATASALNEGGVILGGDILVMRSEKILNRFFAFWVAANKKSVMQLVSGSTVFHLYGSDMEKIKMRLPHCDEQQKIADFLSVIDAKITAVSAQITQMQDFKKGLLQQMFV